MATITAGVSGYYDDGATWVGGIVPSSTDIAQSGAFNVTIRTPVVVAALVASNSSAGGFFTQGNVDIRTTTGIYWGNYRTTLTISGDAISVVLNFNNILLNQPSTNAVVITTTNSTISLIGSPTGGQTNYGYSIVVTGSFNTITYTGSLTPSANSATTNYLLVIGGSSNITNVIAPITGVNLGSVVPIFNGLNNTMNIYSTVTAGSTAIAANNVGTMFLYSTTRATPTFSAVTGTGTTYVTNCVSDSGRLAVTSLVGLIDGVDSQWSMKNNLNAPAYLYTPSGLTGYPPESKVESGEVYGPVGEFEGTLDPVTISVGQIADLANALGLHITPQLLAAVTQ